MCTESFTASRGIAIINKGLYQLKGSYMVDACGVALVVSSLILLPTPLIPTHTV